jgi:flagellar basal body-associated protein FliL
MKRTQKKKKNKQKPLIFILVIVIALMITGGLFVKRTFFGKKTVQAAKVVDKLDKYGYTLEDNATKYQTELFKELKTVLSDSTVDEEKYASLVGQLFLTDYFTLNTKSSKNNVGGVQFVYKDYQDNFIKQATDQVYKYVESNIYGNRKQELPIVSKVTVTDVSSDSYDYLEETDDKAFTVECAIEYEKDLGYQTNATLVMVHANDKLEIVKMS